MLELRNVTKTVSGVDHIRDVSLTLRHGSLNVLLGPTLSGKTSLMRLMAGLDAPTSGSVWFDGTNVTGVPVQKRNVAMVYQQFINYPAMTVYENIASPLRVAGADKAGSSAKSSAPQRFSSSRPTSTARRSICRAASSSARRSPAPSSRTQAWSCSTSRWQTSTTSCARNCARNCRRYSPKPARSSSTPRPSRTRRCCSAATPRRCPRAGSPSSARQSTSSASRSTSSRPKHLPTRRSTPSC